MRTLAALLLVAMLHPAPATAGVLRGTVTLPQLPAKPTGGFHPYAGRASSLPSPARTLRGRVTDTVLWLKAVPDTGGLARTGEVPRLAQQNEAFAPRVVVVPAGGSVEFPNLDPIYHNVFSVSPARRFDLGKYPRGQSRRLTFDKPGIVNVFCDIHTDMAAFIVVTPTPAYARPNENGEYAFAPLPAGHYRLVWWHPDLPGGEADVDVPAEGDAARDVSF